MHLFSSSGEGWEAPSMRDVSKKLGFVPQIRKVLLWLMHLKTIQNSLTVGSDSMTILEKHVVKHIFYSIENWCEV
jgi:hypothetical protein